MNKDVIKRLREPFPFEEVEAKIQTTNAEKTKGMAVFYLDSRAIQKRLDETVDAMNWSNEFSSWHNNAQLCSISIYNDERGEWVSKKDGAENSDIEPIKGGLTDAFKRAAVLWGIGRYLYQIDGVWVEIEQRGKGYYIKDSQQSKLKTIYEAAVKKVFGAPAKPPASVNGSKPENKEPNRKPATPASETIPAAAVTPATPPAAPVAQMPAAPAAPVAPAPAAPAASGGGAVIVAPVAGIVLRCVMSEGADVKSGDTIIIMESMKMELEIKSPASGKIHYIEAAGTPVESQQPIAELR
jgi:biotin carboxyl carrier protein